MKASETVLFTDLDGTLFDSKQRVSAENREAIARYIEQGGLFAISSGRCPQNALTFLTDLPINGPSVMINGCAIYDFQTGTFSHTHCLDRRVIDPLYEHLIASYENLDVQLVTPEGIIYATPEATANPLLLGLHRPCRFLTLKEIPEVPFFKTLLYVPERAGELYEEVRAASEGLFDFRSFESDAEPISYFEVMPLGISKGLALRSLRDDPRVKGRTFFAVGDYLNDMELIREADVGIATANAIDTLKAIADRVTVSNNESAIAHVIDSIIPET